MALLPVFDRIRASLQSRGWLQTARRGARHLYQRVVPRREQPHPFDLRSGLDTGGLLGPEKIASGHAHDAHATAYFGSQPSAFRGVMARWLEELRASGEHLEDFTFVDIGCGKGRILVLASEFAFRRVVGVDLSPALVRTARENLRRWPRSKHACGEISVIEADVLDYTLPASPALVYLYHPFEAELFERWVEHLQGVVSARSQPLYLAYMNPVHGMLLLRLREACLLWSGEIPFSAEEAAVHLFGGTAEAAALYRLTAGSLRG